MMPRTSSLLSDFSSPGSYLSGPMDESGPITSEGDDFSIIIPRNMQRTNSKSMLTDDHTFMLNLPMNMESTVVDLRSLSTEGLPSPSKFSIAKMLARNSMLEQAMQFTNTNGYRNLSHLGGRVMAQHDRHWERAMIQRDANMALQLEDCREANFADYVHYDPEEFEEASPTPSFSDEDSSEVRIGIPLRSCTLHAPKPRKRGVVEELVSRGVSPGEVAKLSDLFEYPSCLKAVDMSFIPWIKTQTEQGYWRNEAALFVLCVTMAISVGNVETLFKLNASWSGMVFLVPYFFAYILVVQPMICLELMLGQLYRGGQSAIYDKLRRGCSGLGTAIVVICLCSGCFACARCAAEYILYIFDIFKRQVPWKLAPEEITMCNEITDRDICMQKIPMCYFANDVCVPSALGKAYLAYQSKFYTATNEVLNFEPSLAWAIVGTYGIVSVFQFAGMGNFTFSASLVIIIAFFVTHIQVGSAECARHGAQAFTAITLDGGTDFLWESFRNLDWSHLYRSSRIWSHSLRSCMYEYIIGSGIYTTLAAKSRIGYDISKETVGVGIFSGYVTMLLFGTACALIGHYAKLLRLKPIDIMWMLGQDCSYILLPLGFKSTENMERTLCMLQFSCCVVMLCSTLAIQIEVAVANIKDLPWLGINKLHRRWTSLCIILVLMCSSLMLCSRTGKRVVWFLEIAVGDLGRAFTVFIASIVVGWLYGCDKQKEALGTKAVYTFNAVFWAFNFVAFLCETSDEYLWAIVWWFMRAAGIAVALAAAYHFNQQDPERSKTLSECAWWLCCGNVEQLRMEICRISPLSNVGGLPMKIFWSICIKWFVPCMMSNTIADVFEEIVAPHRVAVQVNKIPPGWQWVTILLWAFLICIVFVPPILLWVAPNLVPVYETIDLSSIPSCPVKHSFWQNLVPRNLFRELYCDNGRVKPKVT
ncbi:hypothetcial protein, putative [Babesia bigemina]|uniref:Hypothetcial protein, putative n=1 Tax=Babesia bigemina TaxID=5866 RepID=A0A061D5P0_BABBI|nr:hypothetcial protein, putative [Babesia bigemina]CDR96041.1 hypothetcial protein, putative [Babesia bigemina]|eukprot:XP_012768227.1 hypothetcial protein, putative [Babesia bigemina]